MNTKFLRLRPADQARPLRPLPFQESLKPKAPHAPSEAMGCRRNLFCILGRDHAERRRTAEDPDEQPSEPTGADNNGNTEGGSIAQGQIINLVVVKPNKSAKCGVVMASNEETGMTYIRSVTRGGLFESAGARENDFLMSIDGEEVTGSKMAAALLGGADGRFEVMIERSGPMWVSESVEAVLAKADNTLDHGNHELGVIMGQTLRQRRSTHRRRRLLRRTGCRHVHDVDASRKQQHRPRRLWHKRACVT